MWRSVLASLLAAVLAPDAVCAAPKHPSLRASVARLAEEAAPAPPPKPFFRTKKGIVAIVLLAAGVVWAVHASQSERVASPLR